MTSKKRLSKRIICTIMVLCFLVPIFNIAPAFAAPAAEDESVFPPLNSYWWDDVDENFEHPVLTVTWDEGDDVGALVEGVLNPANQNSVPGAPPVYYDVYIGGDGDVDVELSLETGYTIKTVTDGVADALVDGIDGNKISLKLGENTDDNNAPQVLLEYEKSGVVGSVTIPIRFQKTAATAVAVTGSGEAIITRHPALPTNEAIVDQVRIGPNEDGIRVTNIVHYTRVLFSTDAISLSVDGDEEDDIETVDVVTIDTVEYYILVFEPSTDFHYVEIEFAPIVDATAPVIKDHPESEEYEQFATPTALTVTLDNEEEFTDDDDITYQWYENDTDSNEGGLAIVGAEEDSFEPSTLVADTFYYYVIVTNTNEKVNGETKATAVSNVATIEVTEAEKVLVDAEKPVITTHPQSPPAPYIQNATPTALTVVVKPLTDDGTLSYQWLRDGTEISGATTSSYTPSTAATGTSLYCVDVTNTNTASEITGEKVVTTRSNTATVIVNPEGFIAVTDITLSSSSGTVGTPFTLNPTVAPTNATNKEPIVWSLVDPGTTAATMTSLGVINVTAAGSVKVEASIEDGKGIGAPFTKEFTITFTVQQPPSGPSGGDPAPTPTPVPPAQDPVLPTTEVTPTVPDEEAQEEVADAVEELNDNWASDVEQVGDAITVHLPKQEPTVVTLTNLPDSIDVGDVTVMAIVNPDGTLTPVPTRIINGKIVVVLEKDATLVPLHVTAQFNDLLHVPSDVQNEINKAASLLIVEGFPTGDFKPSEKVTVQQAVAMFLRASGIKVDYATAMATGLENKLIGAGLNGSDPMSRIQTAELIVHALAHFGLEYKLTADDIDDLLADFPDVSDLSSAEREALAICVHLGIFKGFTDHTMRPDDILNRSQMASLAVRMQDVLFHLN